MTRTTTPATDAELAKSGTQQHFILSLGFSTTIHVASRGPLSWNGNTYQAIFFQLSGISSNDYGLDSAIIRLGNFDNALSDVIFSEGLDGKSAELRMLYGDGPWAVDDPIPLLIGEMDRVLNIDEFVDLQIIRPNANTFFTPSVYYEHQNILPAGSKVTLRNKTVTIGG